MKAVLKAGMKEEDIVGVVKGRGRLAEAEGSWHSMICADMAFRAIGEPRIQTLASRLVFQRDCQMVQV